jgi:hypothetical protein
MVTFKQLWANHPTNSGNSLPCRTLGISNFENQCAIRMGVCLKDSGVALGQIGGAITCSQVLLTNHAKDEMHFVRAKELANALRRGGIPGIGSAHSLQTPADFANELDGRRGIIFFNGYWWRKEDKTRPTGDHIDLWNGWRTTAKALFPWFGWLGGYNKSGEIWFWEVK